MNNIELYEANGTTYKIKYIKSHKYEVYQGEKYVNTLRSRPACKKAIWQRERVKLDNKRELFNEMKMGLL